MHNMPLQCETSKKYHRLDDENSVPNMAKQEEDGKV